MSLKAHLEEFAARGQRSQPRRALLLETSGLLPGGLEANVRIHNLSASGLLLETGLDLAEGDSLAIELPESGPVEAEVVWQSDRLFGCAFNEPLPRSVLAAAQFGRMGMIVVLGVGLVVIDVARRIVIPLVEFAVAAQHFTDDIVLALPQQPVTFHDLGPGSRHVFQPLSRQFAQLNHHDPRCCRVVPTLTDRNPL